MCYIRKVYQSGQNVLPGSTRHFEWDPLYGSFSDSMSIVVPHLLCLVTVEIGLVVVNPSL